MNLSVIFHGDWEVYAHRDPVSGKKELLQEHITRCEKYRIRISQERKLLKIEENFLTNLGLDKDDFAGKLAKEMIDAVILFHDLGKGTPASTICVEIKITFFQTFSRIGFKIDSLS